MGAKPPPMKGKLVKIIDYEGKEHIVIPIDMARSAVEWAIKKFQSHGTSMGHLSVSMAEDDINEAFEEVMK